MHQKTQNLVDVIKKKIEDGEPLPSKKALMIEAGYTEKSADVNQAQTFNGKDFRLALDNLLSDSFLLQKHKELLQTKELRRKLFSPEFTDDEIADIIVSTGGQLKKIIRPDKGDILVYYVINNTPTVASALDMGYKLKGRYAPEKQLVYDVHSILKEIQSEESQPLVKQN